MVVLRVHVMQNQRFPQSEIDMHPELIFAPKDTHLAELRAWLQEEDIEMGEGFFCNWSVIEGCFQENGLHCISVGGTVLGFLAWQKFEHLVRLHICEVHPRHRGRGLGRRLMEESLAKFESEGILVADLECMPANSEPIWRKMGFVDFPHELKDPYRSHGGIKLYRPLPVVASQNETVDADEVLELWACEPWGVQDKAPAWTWEIVREPGTTRLIKPIIFPCKRDWNLSWRKGGVTICEEKMKYFKPESLEDTYLVYTHLEMASPKSE